MPAAIGGIAVGIFYARKKVPPGGGAAALLKEGCK